MDTKEKNYSGIVMYTFHEGGDKLREFIQAALEKDFDGIPLDQSTYGIAMGGISPNVVITKLKDICDNAVTYNEGKDFISGDFVTLYHPINAVIKGSKEPRIERIEIIKI